MERQKKLAVISDLSGYGRCSLTVTLPIISAMKIQCCPVITSILSNHTGFSEYYMDDYTDKMPAYIEKWKRLHLDFDGILTGYLGSEKQIDIVIDFISHFKKENTKVIVDPVMGDNGRTYHAFTPELCNKMERLAEYACLMTPNVTEACILTGTAYKELGWTKKELIEISKKLIDKGAREIVITGIKQGGFLANFVYHADGSYHLLKNKQIGSVRCGTGDVFAAIVAGSSMQGHSLEKAVKKASGYIQKCMLRSDELNIPMENGVCFEEYLYTLGK